LNGHLFCSTIQKCLRPSPELFASSFSGSSLPFVSGRGACSNKKDLYFLFCMTQGRESLHRNPRRIYPHKKFHSFDVKYPETSHCWAMQTVRYMLNLLSWSV
jgi:hypothetical protein